MYVDRNSRSLFPDAEIISNSIITGAGGGIGFAIVRGLIHTAPHYFVLGIDVNTQQLETLQKLYPSQLLAITGDVRDRSVSATAVEKAISRTGRIDTLVLNAGILNPVGSISDTSVADWERNFAVNFFSLLHTVRHLCLVSTGA